MLEMFKKYVFRKDNLLRYTLQVYNAVNTELDNVDSDDTEALRMLISQKKLLDEIVEYINSFKYISHRETKERVRVYIESNCNYDTMCDVLGVSKDCAKSSISYINNT